MKKLENGNYRLQITNFLSVSVHVLCLCLSVAYVYPAFAQMSAEELRREQIETIEALKGTENISGGGSPQFLGKLGRKTGWLFTYGAAHSTTYTGGDNGSDRNDAAMDASDHSYDYEVKPHVTISTADRKTKFYVRMTTKYTEASTINASVRGNNFVQPTIDMAYWEKGFDGKTAGVKNKFTAGRQFVQVGRGIAFSGTGDGVQYEQTGLAAKKGEWKAFVVRQPPGNDRGDASASGAGRSKLWAAALRGKYNFRNGHTPLLGQKVFMPTVKMSLYAVHIKDNNTDQNPTSAFQKHNFEPEYYGSVTEGYIRPGLQYWGEVVYERGKTYSHGTAAVPSQKINIDADMWTAGLKYWPFPKNERKPTLFFEYIQASGDPDTLATSSTSSQNGSEPGTKDSRFIPMGGLGMGVALSPTLNNMKVYKVGGSIKPFALSEHRILQDMSIQPEYYVYRRRTGNTGGAGNDSIIQNVTSDKIGDELNFSISWRLMSDVTYQLKYGHFSPGTAYNLRSSETYWKFKISLEL